MKQVKKQCHKCKASDHLTEFLECGTWGRTTYVCNECKHSDAAYQQAMRLKADAILYQAIYNKPLYRH